MKKLSLLILFPSAVFSQLNCNVFEDKNCKKACELANYAEPYQGFRKSQEAFDEAIMLCPSLDYAYREKSVPYLKRGLFIAWKELIDRAVEINPRQNLGYRGWCKYQFLRDYKGALEDIESFEKLVGAENIGYSQNGNYSLQTVKALCYRGLGNNAKALEIMEDQLSKKNNTPLMFDYYHLGVVYFAQENFIKAKENFERQIMYNDYFAEPYYYLALISEKEGNITKARELTNKALSYYCDDKYMKDSYTTVIDKIYKANIENLKKNLLK